MSRPSESRGELHAGARGLGCRAASVVVCATMLLLGPAASSPGAVLRAQDAPESNRINVFFDCEGRQCDGGARTFYRTELSWVNWVRDQNDADVHLIMTSQRTGSGGYRFQLDYLGREALDGVNDQFFYTTLGTDVEQEELDGISTAIGIGIARYAALLGYRDFVVFEPAPQPGAPDRVVDPQEIVDPWNLWIFRVGGSGRLDGSDTRVTKNLDANFTASRTTPVWEVNFNGNIGYDHQEIERNDSTTFVNEQTDWAFNSQVFYALAEHWSVGLITQSAKMTRVNQDFRIEVTPTLEYSFFPYEEATRRALTARYSVGPAYRDYAEETVYGETEETRWEHGVAIRFSQRQPWGDGSINVSASHYLHDPDLHNVSLRGNLSFRIARGLNLNAGANASWVTDQIYLSAGGETDEEILLRLRTRASDFNYGFNLGFSYQFGSIFNNVVNNRWAFQGPGG